MGNLGNARQPNMPGKCNEINNMLICKKKTETIIIYLVKGFFIPEIFILELQLMFGNADKYKRLHVDVDVILSKM